MSDLPPSRRHPAATALVGSVAFVGLLWIVELVDVVFGGRLAQFGIRPLSVDGLVGVVFAPLLHTTWGHLLANTGPLLVLGFVILLSGVGQWFAATAIIWVVGGVGTWLIVGPGTIHVGASVLVFGWIVYLVLRGFFTRHPVQIIVGVGVLLVYGGVLWGVFPTTAGVSWQGHLCGAIGGGIAALVIGRRTPRTADDRA